MRSCTHIRGNTALYPSILRLVVHDPSHGPWKGFGALAGMAAQRNGHQGAFPRPRCAGFEWSPDRALGVRVHEGRRLGEDSTLVRGLLRS